MGLTALLVLNNCLLHKQRQQANWITKNPSWHKHKDHEQCPHSMKQPTPMNFHTGTVDALHKSISFDSPLLAGHFHRASARGRMNQIVNGENSAQCMWCRPHLPPSASDLLVNSNCARPNQSHAPLSSRNGFFAACLHGHSNTSEEKIACKIRSRWENVWMPKLLLQP